MSVHYKFKNSSEFSTVTFDGVHISVGDLKRAIIQQKKVGKSPDCDLQITDSESKKVYDTEDQLIPKNSSVVVARVPFGERLRKGWNRNEDNPSTQIISHGRAYIDKITKSDLTNEYATEEERIKAMVSQSTSEYDTSKYVRTRGMGPLPAGYTCYRCGQTGHYIKHCPTNNTDIKRSTGIPRSFMVTASADTKGALLTANGEYAVPLIDAEAYKQTKKEKPPFAYNDSADNSNDAAIRISKEFQCPICQDLLTDAVLTPCCSTNHCDECIRNHLMESEAHECPSCHELNVSPENLIANQKLRSDVAKIIKDTGYTHGRAVVFYSGDEENEDAITPSNKENSAEPSSNELLTASQPEPTAASTEDNSESSSQAFQHNDTIMDAAILGDQQQKEEEEAEESKSTVASTTDVEDDESMPTSSSQNNNNQLPTNQIQNLVQPAGFFNQGPYMNRPPMMNPQYRYPPHIRPPMYDMYGQPTGYFPPPNNNFMGPYGAGPGYYYWQYNNRCNGPRNFGPPNNPMNSNYNSFPNFFDPSINYEEAVERFERHLASRSRRSRSRSRSASPVNRDRNRRYRDERRSRSPRHERDRRRSPDRRRDQKRRSHDRSRSSKGKTKSSKTKDKDKEKSKDKSKDKAKERTKDKTKEKSRDKAKDKDITEDIAKKDTSKDTFSRDNSSKDSSSKAKDKSSSKDKSRDKTKDKAKEKSSKSKA